MESCSEDSMDGFMQLRSSIKTAKLYLTRVQDSKQKEVRVGVDYQAVIPPYRGSTHTTPQENSVILWVPNQTDEEIRSYLYKACVVLGDCGRDVLPSGKQCRDDELALYYLYKTGPKIVKNLKEIRSLYQTEGGLELDSNFRQVEPWSVEDCERFESGLRKYWKNFQDIQKEMLPHRKLLEIVEFYYFWKKSERFENFLQHSRKKKVTGTGYQGNEQRDKGDECNTGVDKVS
eukprot:TRINITY_DN10454_c0_g1_i1.p1 TRINITY_DN10454_c0_g1~~TRINITY_DN10454_c0_g1_i1.p1  ORF type:complete len:232 (+),score=70.90 TRINITY_DN10454_c0_g1_i1:194-889(+)